MACVGTDIPHPTATTLKEYTNGGEEMNKIIRHIMAQAISVQSTTSRIYFRRRKTNLVAK